ncbi:hypothetical protein [Neisseria sp.]
MPRILRGFARVFHALRPSENAKSFQTALTEKPAWFGKQVSVSGGS